MTTIGQTLAAAREDLGYSLADLSARTCIRQPVLAGMEGDDFRVCGGDFYARGHIRSVCRELGLDPGPLIEEFDREHARGSMAPAFTGAPVTTGTVHPTGRSSAAGDAAEERAKEGARERAEERAAPAAEAPAAAPQAAVPAPRGPRDTEAAVAASGAGRARRGAAG
ncbi:helix-turn-helix domain-containing protein, partial [Streptomonospora nanhaiensis]|uniref:helix-turn-helix domain-containing protein n=1 Tax=Streptomonospora nanhaiensis TaxID=1323731 RepID=UPI001C391D13